MNYYSILEGLGLKKEQIKRYYQLIEENTIYFEVELIANQRKCPYCHSENAIIKEYKTKSIKFLSIGKNNTIVDYKLPRYKCKSCLKTYTHNLDNSTDKTISNEVIKKLINEFSDITTFSNIGKRYGISTTKIIEIFDKYCPNLRYKIDEVLCLDEFSNIRKSNNKYACILIDFKTHKIIDIIQNRTLPYLRQYFSKQPLKLREKVKYIVTDMYDGYITIAKEYFHNAVIAIDPFHYMSYFTNAIQNIRRRILDSGGFFYDKSWISSHWRLLSTNPDNFPKETMILPSGQSISYYDRVIKFVKQNNELAYSFFFLQDFFITSKNLSFDKAKSFITMVINNMLSSISIELVECGKTWFHYKDFIINSFIKYNNFRLSNGHIEGINSRIKTLKKIYCGYRNELRFYNRIILIINKKRG